MTVLVSVAVLGALSERLGDPLNFCIDNMSGTWPPGFFKSSLYLIATVIGNKEFRIEERLMRVRSKGIGKISE